MTSDTPQSFTGRARRRTTRRSVRLANHLARFAITVGGIGTIVAVLGVAVFLVWVVLPLFLPAKVGEPTSFDAGWRARPLRVDVDEYQVLTYAVLPSGELETRRLDDGRRLAVRELFPGRELTAAAFVDRGERAVFGFADGGVTVAELGFESSIRNLDELPEALRRALESRPAGDVVDEGEGVVERTIQDQARLQQVRFEPGTETRLSGPVRLLGLVERTGGPLVVALVEEPGGGGAWRLEAISGEQKSDFMTGQTRLALGAPVDLPLVSLAPVPPAYLAISGSGSDVYVAWESGEMFRIQVPPALRGAAVVERGRLVPPGRRLTALGFVLGNTTLVWGDSEGNVTAGFQVRLEDEVAGAVPGLEVAPAATSRLVAAKNLAEDEGSAVRSVAPSARSRLLLMGFADGRVRLANVTNATTLRTFRLPVEEAVDELRMTPKEDGLLALAGGRLFHASLDPRYPEAGFQAFFRPVWYEGYPAPQHLWQSSSGTDDFEPKLGLYPLIFGTIKATVYSMLFGAPLALLAALFTSEFLDPRTKAVVKPTIEIMASLPSVVLGFIAALVIAPFLEDVLPATLALGITVPACFLLGAQLWQLAPTRFTLHRAPWRIAFVALALPVGVVLAIWLGPAIERWLFAGDVRAWLAWAPGGQLDSPALASPLGGWMLLFLPLSALATSVFAGRFVGPWMRARGARWDRRQFALVDLGRFAAGLVVTVGLALLVSAVCGALGFDPRGSYVDTYVQRNALIVGFVMGFAIIPIIYTISEDALSTVPEHLRSASLGAGATPWQTAIRIVVPTAMSGLFSAVMVGLGRAVGETMIVLMAAGNTPVLEWNVFEGFRTLSANIAVELPEAVRGSTHYRTLFFAALVLFVMTFAVNTVAEIIRQRFRKRAYQL